MKSAVQVMEILGCNAPSVSRYKTQGHLVVELIEGRSKFFTDKSVMDLKRDRIKRGKHIPKEVTLLQACEAIDRSNKNRLDRKKLIDSIKEFQKNFIDLSYCEDVQLEIYADICELTKTYSGELRADPTNAYYLKALDSTMKIKRGLEDDLLISFRGKVKANIGILEEDKPIDEMGELVQI